MHILIADDDETSLTMLEMTLQNLGHTVVSAEDGRTALNAFEAGLAQVIITDWRMPDIDGIELCRRVRALRRPDYTYIIVLTATMTGRQAYIDALAAGADDFMTKPPDEEQLAARLLVAERILGIQHRVSQLEGILPICSYCKKIRIGNDQWRDLDHYVADQTGARFSHGACPSCYETLMKDLG